MKHKILAVIPVLALLGAAFGYAASLGISGIDQLGSATEVVSPPELEVTDVQWTVSAADSSKVGQVDITIEAIGWMVGDDPYGPCDFYFVLKDSGGAVLDKTTVMTKFVNSSDGEWTFEWDLGSAIPAEDIAVFAITVIEEVP